MKVQIICSTIYIRLDRQHDVVADFAVAQNFFQQVVYIICKLFVWAAPAFYRVADESQVLLLLLLAGLCSQLGLDKY